MSKRVKVTAKGHEAKKENSAPQQKASDLSQPLNSSVDQILFLQRTIGNQAVQRLISSGALRTKLKIGSPGDVYEQEADRVAEHIVNLPVPSRSFMDHSLSVQRTTPEGELHRKPGDEEEKLQAKRIEDTPQEANENIESHIQSMRGGGQRLPESVRAFFEPRFGADFSQVRVHTDAKAAETARAVDALAYNVGQDVVFAAGKYAPEMHEGRNLLAHELTHVVQQGGDATTLKLQRRPRASRSRAPFEKILKLNEQVGTALAGFVTTLKALPNPSKPLQDRIDKINKLFQSAVDQKIGGEQVVDAWVAGNEIPIDAPVDTMNYVLDDKPSKKGLEYLERLDSNILALIDLVLPRVINLSKTAESLGADTPIEMRQAFHTVAGYYLDTLTHASQRSVFDSIKFLDTFYQDPRLIQGYGLWAYIRAQLPDLYDNLLRANEVDIYPLPLGRNLKSDDPRFFGPGGIYGWEKEKEFESGGLQGQRAAELAHTINAIRDLKLGEEQIGILPDSLKAVGKLPSPNSNAALLRLFIDVQVRTAILRLWRPIDPLQRLLNSTPNAGQYLLPFTTDDRERWLNELNKLEIEFAAEMRLGDHPGIDTKIDGWQKRIQSLVDEIPPEVRQKKIIAAIVEQIPFMFVAGATTARMGMWVRAATQSKWLVALAEGATMTLFTAASIPTGAPNRPQGVLGWTANLAVNVLLARVGRAFFEAGDAVARVALSRSLIASFATRIVVPTVSLAALQTGVQIIEAKITSSGGETRFTELLTINLILNGIGMAVGAATAMPDRPITSTTAGSAIIKPTAPELAKRLTIPEDQARLLLEVADRLGDFQTAVTALNEAAAKGTATKAQFEALKKQGLDLADFLEARLEPLAKAGAFGSATSVQVKDYLALMRGRLKATTWESLNKITALLPEGTKGLIRVGEGTQWVYDRSKPPKELPNLRADYEKRGNTVKALPSGGWEAADSHGNVLLQVIPVNMQAAQVLGKSLIDVAKGPLAQEGLARLRGQTAIPANLLEAQLQQAISAPGGEKAISRVLQQLARFVETNNTKAWVGFYRYLDLGGDPQLLARTLAYGRPNEFAAESKLLANNLLMQMADWDASALEGFQRLYELRPNLTAERLHNLIADFKPDQVMGILQSLALLAPRSKGLSKVIGPLTSGAEMSERGAMGALTSGVQLAKRFPSATLVFEEPVVNAAGEIVRVIDISVQETQTTRVTGVTKTTNVEISAVEVKEVSTPSLGKRAVQELARDIQRDSMIRSQRIAPVGAGRPFFETFTWRIRGLELRQQAIDALQNPAATEVQIQAKMREIVENQLKKVFDRPEFKKLPPSEQDGYRNAFKGVPFVEFF